LAIVGNCRSKAVCDVQAFWCLDPALLHPECTSTVPRTGLRAPGRGFTARYRNAVVIFATLLLSTGILHKAVHASIEETAPNHFTHSRYYASSADALAGCSAFQQRFPPDQASCFDSGSKPQWWAGWFQSVDGSSHFGVFNYNVTCPAGYTLDEEQQCLPEVDPKNNGRNCPATTLISNPVNVGTGNKVAFETLVTSGRLVLPATYNSAATFSASGFGKGWSHLYSGHIRKISLDAESFVTVSNPDGRVLRFNEINGIWTADTDVHDTLEAMRNSQGVITGWRYTREDDTVERFDVNGILQSITDRRGHGQTLSYDTSNRLERVDSDTGEFLTFAYNANNRIASITDNSGRIWGFRYNARKNLEFVDNPDGTTKQYHYEDTRFPTGLTGIIDERGIRYATYAYDTRGRATASYHGPQTSVLTDRIEGVSIVYNDTDGTRSVTNSNGDASTYTTATQLGVALVTDVSGPGCSTCGTGNSSYTYDPANNLLSRTENSITTRFGQYDSQGQYGCKVEGITAADTSTGECAFDPVTSPDAHRVDYTYDPRFFNRITSITEPSVFPGNHKVTTYSYDDFGNRTSETVTGFTPDGTPVRRTTTRQYDGPLNQLSFVDGPRTDVNDYTYYRYYPNDTRVPVGYRARLKEVEDASGVLIRSNLQYTATGKVSSETRPNGRVLTYTYYPGNDRLETLTESGPSGSRVTRWTWLATGEVASITTADGSPDATTLGFGYDEARRLISITDGSGNHLDYTLDTEGNRLNETTYDANGTPGNRADDLLRKQLTRTFDLYNRLDTTALGDPRNPLETTNPDFAPDGTLDQSTDGNGTRTDYRYDALKRLTRVTRDFNGTDPGTANASTTYGYDVADRLTSVTDPNSATTTYTYDDLGNLLSQTSPDTGTTTFQYDAAGNLRQKTDALGQVFTYAYDALNRLTRVNAPGTDDDISYLYDRCLNGTGRLCQLDYGPGFPNGSTVHYQYNAFGDMTAHQGTRYTFDTAGRLQTLNYPSGARLTYRYDSAGQIQQVDFVASGQAVTLAGNLRYAPFGSLTNLTLGNGLLLNQTLDMAYRLTAQTTAGVLERTYPQYDGNGNLLGIIDAITSNSTHTYDALNRLNTASGPFGTRDYDLDKNGNRTQLLQDTVTTPYSYELNSNRLDTLGSVGVTDVWLDATGNTLNLGNRTYTYTPHHRLKTATENATLTAGFRYNGLGQRTRKTDETTGTGRYFLYGSQGELLAGIDQNGNVLKEYIYLNGQLLAVFEPDDNQDGIPNQREAEQGTLPLNTDSDGDGLTNLTEWFQYGTDSQNPDSDGDGIHDALEIARHTDPNLASSVAGDGDLNHDGDINLGDLLLLYQHVLGLRAIDADALTHGDLNFDGQLNAPDLLLLEKKLLQGWWRGDTRLAKHGNGQPDPAAARTGLDWLIAPAQALPNNAGFLYYVHNDPLGTPQALTDESGTVVWKASYDPFGKATVNEDPDNDGNRVTLNIRFPGQYYDNETGLHYNGFRYYSPETGRYLTSDPIGLAGGLNTFLYVAGNPIRYTDPNGLEAVPGTGIGLLPSPAAHPVFQPGTSANDAFVDSTTTLLNSLGNAISNGDGNVIDLDDERDKRKEKEGGKSCPAPQKGGDGNCTFTGLAGLVPASNGFGFYLQCQYRCPRKGLRIDTSYIGIKSNNPAFLCPRTIPESWF